jgi:hypothetical protein
LSESCNSESTEKITSNIENKFYVTVKIVFQHSHSLLIYESLCTSTVLSLPTSPTTTITTVLAWQPTMLKDRFHLPLQESGWCAHPCRVVGREERLEGEVREDEGRMLSVDELTVRRVRCLVWQRASGHW